MQWGLNNEVWGTWPTDQLLLFIRHWQAWRVFEGRGWEWGVAWLLFWVGGEGDSVSIEAVVFS
jgi:hypothetical protein